MKTGIELIAQERHHQTEELGISTQEDFDNNKDQQLSLAASMLCLDYPHICLEEEDVIENHCPSGWDSKRWEKMVRKPRKERLMIAGALIAAELDREEMLLHEFDPKPEYKDYELKGLSMPKSGTFENERHDTFWATFSEDFNFDGLFHYIKNNWGTTKLMGRLKYFKQSEDGTPIEAVVVHVWEV